MSTYRELVYIVSDLAKTLNDDAIINETHIAFLLNKYRTYLLRQKYDKNAATKIPQSAYQTICLNLEEATYQQTCNDSCLLNNSEDKYLRSVEEVPIIFSPSRVKVVGANIFKTEVAIVDPNRMEYVGHNNWLKNVIYGTINYDNHLYLKSSNPALYNKVIGGTVLIFNKVHLSAVFEDPIAAYDRIGCGEEGCSVVCDYMDEQFPFEGALETQLISLVLKELVGAAFRPKDDINNAKDDLADLTNFVRQNLKSNTNNE